MYTGQEYYFLGDQTKNHMTFEESTSIKQKAN